MADLAGNAFAMPCLAAVVLAVLSLVRVQKPAQNESMAVCDVVRTLAGSG